MSYVVLNIKITAIPTPIMYNQNSGVPHFDGEDSLRNFWLRELSPLRAVPAKDGAGILGGEEDRGVFAVKRESSVSSEKMEWIVEKRSMAAIGRTGPTKLVVAQKKVCVEGRERWKALSWYVEMRNKGRTQRRLFIYFCFSPIA